MAARRAIARCLGAGDADPAVACGCDRTVIPPCRALAVQWEQMAADDRLSRLVPHRSSKLFEKPSLPGAPLRNRTVDLLLTMSHWTITAAQVEALTWQYAGTGERGQARISAVRHRSAPQVQHFFARIHLPLAKRHPVRSHPSKLALKCKLTRILGGIRARLGCAGDVGLPEAGPLCTASAGMRSLTCDKAARRSIVRWRALAAAGPGSARAP